jgi:single-strand selective monofunctional uracil DNA glycosylase
MLEQSANPQPKLKKLSSKIKAHTQELVCDLKKIKFPKELFVYHTLDYAEEAFFQYLDKYAHSPLKAVFMGMNPGPFGMMQTGVPFGEINFVKNYLNINSGVKTPAKEHLKRPIEGFNCERSEVSGARLWSLVQKNYPRSKDFFKNYFILNYCPLGFLNERGANVTPDKLSPLLQKKINFICDNYLTEVIPLLEPERLIGIGTYAENLLKKLFPLRSCYKILHPSPASPAANRGWGEQVSRELAHIGLKDFNKPT